MKKEDAKIGKITVRRVEVMRCTLSDFARTPFLSFLITLH